MAAPFPQDLKPLASLRFLAALWILVFYLKDHFAFALGDSAIVARGWLGIDLFFVLSGFTLSHAYLRELEAGRFTYGGFLKNRLARIYPLYSLALLALIGLSLGGAFNGMASAFPLSALPQHFLLAQAWGVAPGQGWNWPAWALSALWGAYVVFPLIAIPAIRLQRPVIVLFWTLLFCLFAYVVLENAHLFSGRAARPFAEITWRDGLLRALPSFALGVALYGYAQEHSAPKNWAWPITGASAAFIVFICFAGYWAGLAWIGFAGLIYGLSEIARHRVERALGGQALALLGASSFALFVTFLPVDLLYGQAMAELGVSAASPIGVRIAALAGEIGACVAVAIGAHLLIDKKLRAFIRGTNFRRALHRARHGDAALRGRGDSIG